MSGDHRYDVLIVKLDGSSTPILEGEKSIKRARSVAKHVRQRPNRRVLILRDGKPLAGGISALDREVYQLWLEANQPEPDPAQP